MESFGTSQHEPIFGIEKRKCRDLELTTESLFTPQTLLQEASAWHTDHAAKHAAAAGNRGGGGGGGAA
jgi:hypothetical protein